MISILGDAGSVQVFGDKRTTKNSNYMSDTIDCTAIGKVPLLMVQNGGGAIHIWLEASVDGVNWGRQKNNPDTYMRAAANELVFLQDTIPITVPYRRLVFLLERFPEVSTPSITLL